MRIILIAGLAWTIALSGVVQAQRHSDDPNATKRMTMREQMMKRNSTAKYVDILGRRGNGPAVGTVAPDFGLEFLKEYDLASGSRGSAGTESSVASNRLSDFRGDRPVVLIFGSYT